MQRDAEDPEELFLPWSLNSHWNIIQLVLVGTEEGKTERGTWLTFSTSVSVPFVLLPVGV